MQTLTLEGLYGETIGIDLCFDCHGIWFDARENVKLSPDGVLTLFHALHAHRHHQLHPLREHMPCPRCEKRLVRGHNRTINGLYAVHRCPMGHGHFSTFPSFMVEKGFVRHLTPAEIHELTRKLRVIHCSSCGAPVDLRRHHACPYCSSAFSLLDPEAMTKALQRFEGERMKRQIAGDAATLALVSGVPADGEPGGNARQPGAATARSSARDDAAPGTASGASQTGAGGVLPGMPQRRGADGSALDASTEAVKLSGELRASLILARRNAEYLGEKRHQMDRIQRLGGSGPFGGSGRITGNTPVGWVLEMTWAAIKHWWRTP